jgi:putative iron-dependent peroxidase
VEGLCAEDAPAAVAGFNEELIGVDGLAMPATQHDAVLWLSGSAYDVIFEVARKAIAELAPLASVVEETSSWPYRHDRDLTGFIDGTENPTLHEGADRRVLLHSFGGRASKRRDRAVRRGRGAANA